MILTLYIPFEMFDRSASRNFLAPRRQGRKEKLFFCFSELGMLYVFARVISFCRPIFNREFQIRLASLYLDITGLKRICRFARLEPDCERMKLDTERISPQRWLL
jgi:hypothetical protein